MKDDNSHAQTNSSIYPSGWVETTLGKIGKTVTGKTPSTKEDFFWGGKIPFITPTDIDNDSRYCVPVRTVSERGKASLKNSIISRNAICYTSIASIGLLCISKQESLTNQQINSLIVNESNNFLFFYYYLRFLTPSLKKIAGGTTTHIINKTQFENFPIILPPLPEQEAIASILSSFDDKIELLREQNKTLEEIGRVIFRKWFGRHGVASELPEGWRVGKLGEEFNITIGRTPPRAESQWFSDIPTGKKWISIKDIGNSGTYIFDTSEYLTDEAINKFNIPVIPENTTILSFKMTVGKLTITTEEMLSNEAIAHFKLKKDSVLSSEYIYSYLQKLDFNALGSTSSIVTAINSTMIKNLEIIIPNQKILKQFDEAIQPIFRKIRNNSEQIQSLARSRDELLPKLMSGQVRVNS